MDSVRVLRFDSTWLINIWILFGPEAFMGKASKGEVAVVYFEPLATQHMEVSDPSFG
jgi:hypothetical protein